VEKKNESNIAPVAMPDSFRTAELGADIPERALRQLDGKYDMAHPQRIPAVHHAFLRFRTSLSNFMDLKTMGVCVAKTLSLSYNYGYIDGLSHTVRGRFSGCGLIRR
jgi:hypothetical protein